MWYRFLADALVVFHLCFVLFVICGGLVVVRWKWVALLHVPAALWGMLVEWTGWMCPLTPLENSFREMGGGVPYEGGFVEHYIMPVLYPVDLTRDFQVTLGTVILLINAILYGIAFTRRRGHSGRRGFEVAVTT
jgi:Protein of Unknown function (DUF2784)